MTFPKVWSRLQELTSPRSVEEAAVMVMEPAAGSASPFTVASVPERRLVERVEVATTCPSAFVESRLLVMPEMTRFVEVAVPVTWRPALMVEEAEERNPALLHGEEGAAVHETEASWVLEVMNPASLRRKFVEIEVVAETTPVALV